MNNKQEPFRVVTPDNLGEIASLLERGGGSIIVTKRSGCANPRNVTFELFQSARINGNCLVAHESNSKTPRSRSYRLYEIPLTSGDPKWDSLRDLSEQLAIEDMYKFQIAGQYICSCEIIFDGSYTLYIPPDVSEEQGLCNAIWHMMDILNQSLSNHDAEFRFTTDHLAEIITYAMDDLRTSKILNANVGAGQVADTALGM